MAWQHISPDVTVKGFMKCCTSSALDGTDEICLEGDGDVRSEWEKDEGTDRENGNSGTDW
jgi:hypothetical protein